MNELSKTLPVPIIFLKETLPGVIAMERGVRVDQVKMTDAYPINKFKWAFNFWIKDGNPDPVAGYLEDHIVFELKPGRYVNKPIGTCTEASDENYALKA